MTGYTVIIRIINTLTGIANAVIVSICLVWIGHCGTVIRIIRVKGTDAVIIRIIDRLAGISNAVAIGIFLFRVKDIGTIIRMYLPITGHQVSIGIIGSITSYDPEPSRGGPIRVHGYGTDRVVS